MKKKHRDIVVGGKTYGWTVTNWELKIWENKKVIATHEFPDSHDGITPSMVKLYIEDPKTAEMLYNAKSCPFCGAVLVEAPDDDPNRKDFFILNHTDDCWLVRRDDFKSEYIGKHLLDMWNKRG